MKPQEITEHTTLRELKQMRQRLKKERNDPFSIKLIEHRIKQLKERHVVKANTEATERMAKTLAEKNKNEQMAKSK